MKLPLNFFILIFTFSVEESICLESYIGKCPHRSQMKTRSSWVCGGNPLENYSCLYGINGSVESCTTDKADYAAPVVYKIAQRAVQCQCIDHPEWIDLFIVNRQRYVVKENPHPENCPIYKYQPYKLWSNRSSDCEFIKSECSELGQIACGIGTTISDLTCRCDHMRGYAFLTTTRNVSLCEPTLEDCSCFLKTCDENTILAPDYTCKQIKYVTEHMTCLSLPDHEDSNFSMTNQTTVAVVKGNRRGNTHIVNVMVFLFLFILVFMISCVRFLKRKHIEHKQLIHSQTVNLFSKTIPGHWGKLTTSICSKDILNDLMKLNFISIDDYNKINNYETTEQNLYILKYLSTKYMVYSSGKFNGAVFRKLLERQPKVVQEILSEDVKIKRWPKRDPVICKKQLEESEELIEQIHCEGFLTDLIECYVFSANDYTKIRERNASVQSLLIKNLQKGSFECFLTHLDKSPSEARSKFKANKFSAIFLTLEEYSDQIFTDSEKSMCHLNLLINVQQEDSKFNEIVTTEIRNYSKWFIHELGLYPTGLQDHRENKSRTITLEAVCPNALHRIRRSFRRDGFTELLERLMCRKEVIDTIKNEKKVYVKLCLNYQDRNIKDFTIKHSTKLIDDVGVLKANKSYLVNEMETTPIIDKFQEYQDFRNIDMSADRKTKNGDIMNIILRNQTYPAKFIDIIGTNNTFLNIRKRLEDSRYVYRKKIETETLRNNIIENIINLLDLSYDLDDFRSKYLDRDIFTDEQFESFGASDLDYVLIIVETLKSGRDAMLTFVDCLFQRGDIDTAEALLVERKPTLNLHYRDLKHHTKRNDSGRKPNNENILEAEFSIHMV